MSIQVQCCGIAVMLVLLYFYRSQKQVNLRTERAYWRMFCAVFVSIALDIISCIVIANMDRLPKLFVEFMCKTYLASFAAIAGFILQYIGSDIYAVKERYRKMLIRYSVCSVIGVAAVYILPIKYFFDPESERLYTYGPSVIATYVFSGGTIATVFFRIFYSWNKMTKRRRDGVLIGVGIILTAAVIQFFNNQLLIIGFSVSICMVVLYLKLENPGYNIDTRTGLFNQNAFALYTSQLYENHNDFSLIEIVYEHDSCRSMCVDELLTEAVNYLLSFPHILAFKTVGSELIILVENSKKADRILEKLRQRFDEGWGKEKDIAINPYWIFVPDPYVVENTNELMNMLRYVRQNYAEYMETRLAVVSKELAYKINEEKSVTELILSALNDDRVEVFYQPIYSTKERKFTAAEALVRIRDEDGNIVPPGKFIKTAESTGMILRLGEEVFRKVCRFIRDNDLRGIGIRYIEVNLSVIQCGYERLADDYIRIMQQHNVSPDMINLEITESASLDTKNILLHNMQRLLDFGVNFSLDDFGTGQSNLNYIIDMPVEIVKFDREMTNAYFENSKAKYIMDAAMNMIHGMNLDIVSEGVETEEQLHAMEKLNISYIQGFYFSKPLPVLEFLSFIAENNR